MERVEEVLSTVRGIVASIDDEVEVDVTQTSEEWQKDTYSVHLSKWGIPSILEITLEDFINARTDDSELRGRLDKEIHEIRQSVQSKVIVKGTVGMLRPFLCNLAAQQGLSPEPSSGRPDWVSGEWDFASFRINRPDREGRTHSLGTVSLQGLPEQRAEITFTRTAGGNLPPKEAQAQFIAFCNKLVDRLEELGFLEGTPHRRRRSASRSRQVARKHRASTCDGIAKPSYVSPLTPTPPQWPLRQSAPRQSPSPRPWASGHPSREASRRA